MPSHDEAFLRAVDAARSRIREVSPQQARALIDQRAVLLEVREQSEFEFGHLSRAVQCSTDQLVGLAETLDKDTSIICYCNGGNRGALAADALQQLGFRNVVSIVGGLQRMRESDG